MKKSYSICRKTLFSCLSFLFLFSFTSQAQFQITLGSSAATCEISSDGTAYVESQSGGVEPLTYEWSDGQNFVVAYNLAAGSYSVTATDATGATATASVTVELSPESVWLMPATTAAACGECNGTADPMAMLGVPPYSYQWSDGQTSPIATGLCPGTYSVTVSDSQGCANSVDVVIGQVGSTVSVSASSTDASCSGNDGSASATASGGVGSYTYSWSNGATSSSISGLGAGTYSVTATDADGCTASTSVTVNSPAAPSVSVSTSNATCGEANGSASATASGGQAPYTYAWSNGATSSSISGLGAGTYSVTVTDAAGCVSSASGTVSDEGGNISVSVSTTNADCGADNGSATATASSGTAPYTYLWSNGATSESISDLGIGTYSVTVTDASGCTGEASGTVEGTDAPTAGTISTDDETDICIMDGTPDPITVDVTGASGESFAWVITDLNANIVALPPGPTFDLENGSPGSCLIWYVVYDGVLGGAEIGNNASDLTGCFALSNSIQVNRNQADAAEISTDDPTEICVDGTGDPIDVTVTGGFGDNSAWVITDDAGNILALPAGPPFDLDGAGPGVCLIWYLTWSGDLSGAEVGNNAADLAGCYALSNAITVTRTAVEAAEISTDDPTDICVDGTGDPIDVAVSGGTGENSAWVITDDAGNILALPAGPPFDLDGAGPGVCLIWYLTWSGDLSGAEVGNNASDLDGCYALSNAITVNRNTPPTVSISSTDISECGATDGALSASVDGGSGNYSYAWSNGSSSADNDNLGEGTYAVTVTDNDSGCTAEASASLDDGGINIGNYVWFDNNENCQQDFFESGVAFVPVELYSAGPDGLFCTADDVLEGSSSTDADGFYLFECVDEGTYYVQFHALAVQPDYEYTCQNEGDDAEDSDVNDEGKTDPFTVSGSDDMTIDAGINPICNDLNFGGSICCDQEICPGEIPAEIGNETLPGGGGAATIEYLWLCTTNPSTAPGGSTWTPIADSNSASYQPGPVYQTKYFVRCARRAGCDQFIVESNVVKIKVISCGLMVDFNATPAADGQVTIDWTIEDDSQTNRYQVERSTDNTHFTVIATVNGEDAYDAEKNYSYTDTEAKIGRSFYRVKQIQSTGDYTFSNTEEVVMKLDNAQRFSVYPNPAQDVINLENIQSFDTDVTVEVLTNAGLVLETRVFAANTMTQKAISIDGYAAGTYFVRITYGAKDVEMMKVTKLK